VLNYMIAYRGMVV